MSIEAMKQALEVLESCDLKNAPLYEQICAYEIATHKAITSLRTAIEQAEKQEPVDACAFQIELKAHMGGGYPYPAWVNTSEMERLVSHLKKVGDRITLYTHPAPAAVVNQQLTTEVEATVQESVAWPMQEQPDGTIIPVDPSEMSNDQLARYITPPVAPVQDIYNTTSDPRLMEMPAGSCKTCEALARTVMMDQTAHDTHPPKREWVGLTDDDYKELHLQMGPVYFYQDYGHAIEAKLREKNA